MQRDKVTEIFPALFVETTNQASSLGYLQRFLYLECSNTFWER